MHSRGRKIAVLVIGIFIGYVIGESSIAAPPTTTNTASVVMRDKIPEVKEFSIKISDRKIVVGNGDIRVREGDVVSIAIVVNEEEELHLHGYDKAVELAKDATGTLTFIANSTGRFPFELEHSKTELGAVSVLPK